MRGFTTAQMRRNVARLIAAGLAVAIATAFVAATLLTAGVIQRTTYDTIGAGFAHADLVVAGDGITDEVATAVQQVDGVEAADGVFRGSMLIGSGTRFNYAPIVPGGSVASLQTQELIAGELPSTGEVALPDGLAERLGVGVGDRLTATFSLWRVDGPEAEGAEHGAASEPVERTLDVRISGIVADPRGAFLDTEGAAIVALADARAWVGDGALWHDHLLVAVTPDADVGGVRTAVADALGSAHGHLGVRTREQQIELLLDERSGATNLMTSVVLGFAAVAMVVAAFVIANTFAVLVAQRTRTLALLRCVGASRRQVHRTVTIEAALLGLIASMMGMLLGAGLTQLALSILRDRVTDVPLPAAISPTLASTLVPVLLGTLVTVLAALAPARAASRVAPIAALRPAAAPAAGVPGSRARLVAAATLTIVGSGLLALAVVASAAGPLVAVLIGVMGGAISFTGVLLGAVFWLPRVLGAAGAALARFGGPTSELAATNAVRNPRRTAATSSALLIGVTLVTMMSTGAASARQSLTDELDGTYPVDIELRAHGAVALGSATPSGADDPSLGSTVTSAVSSVDGVAAVAPMATIDVVIRRDDGDYHLEMHGFAPQQAGLVMRDPSLLDGLADDTLVLPSGVADALAVRSGEKHTLVAAGIDGEVASDGPTREVTLLVSDVPGWTAIATEDLAAALAPDAAVDGAWVRLQDPGEAASVTASIRDLLQEDPVQITGAAVERAAYDRTIDTTLAIVVGLLGVAVVIALVGVANTLSLAVIERRRESATLRAIGLTKRALRGSLAIEGALITVGGAVLGTVLGTIYGWAGARTLIGAVSTSAPLVVAWRDVAIMLAVAVLAGLLASVLPARSAVRTSPVAALGSE